MQDAASRAALITGGTSGIGFQTARRLGEAGFGVLVINGRNAERGAAAAARLREEFPGAVVVFAQADASTAEGAARLAQACREHAPQGMDVLVNSAGGDLMPKLFHQLSPEEIEAVVRHWLFSVLHVCHAILPLIRKGGAIVNVASDAAKVPTVGETVIGAALAGITMFTRALAMEAKRNGIRVNAVTPSLVEGTATTERIYADPFSTKLFTKAKAAAHLGVPEAGDVADTIAFLASPNAKLVTGQLVSVNGGISA